MAQYAFIDKERTIKIYPDKALIEKEQDNNVEYYCPNPECNAKLVPVNGDDNKHPKPFFRALRSRKHIEDCDYKAYYDEEAAMSAAKTRNAGLYVSDFSIEVLLDKMCSYIPPEKTDSSQNGATRTTKDDEETVKEKIISNTTKLYHFCKTHNLSDRLGEKEIRELVIDDRSIFETYKRYIKEGTYLIELPVYKMSFLAESQTLRFRVRKSFRGNLNVDYFFHLHFISNDLYWEKYKEYKEYKETRSTVVLISKVSKKFGDDKNYYCDIFNPAQLHFARSDELIEAQEKSSDIQESQTK